MNPLLTLMQINDSVFPIGGFTHSYGLETYISKGIVKDSKTAKEYAKSMLEYSFFYNDAAFFHKTWEICDSKATKKKVQELDSLITAYKAPYEIRDASKKLGIRFLKLTEKLQPVARCTTYLKSIQSSEMHGHYAVAFAMYAHAQKIEYNDALSAFYYNSLNGIVTNCAKLVPISQMDAQQILFKLQPLINVLVERQPSLEEDLIGNCCVAQDIRCMQHEKLYTRIYIS
ncbi:urease accessory protein UreF [Sphingobacterium shayense]|uniref:urease accessory protein UreF n=1 Tax=Sphingobacterium shayense TaxID=626343 RepID=UPI00155512E3|nr:urease accessory protein UreF [Sphingobacterium shayense]NQD71737.1 urease accessory protein UreF [Sphingobacterium shayense]